MADPVSASVIGGIGLASSAAGGLTGAFSSLFGGQAQSTQAGYQARIADMNSTLAKQDAEYARAAGESEAVTAGIKGREIVGGIRAGYGAANIDSSRGSAASVIKSQTEVNQTNEAIIRSNAAKRAYGFEVTAAEDTAQGNLYRMASSTALTAGDIGATSSLLGGVGSVSTKWLQGNQQGLWGGGSGAGVNPDSLQGQQTYSNSIYT